MLTIENLHTYYGAIHALKGISLTVNNGEVVCLIGANGAGKSTLVNTISGLLRARSGKVTFQDKDITNLDAHKIVKMGLRLSPEGREVFPDLTVEDNLRLGAYVATDKKQIEDAYERCYRLFPKLKDRRRQQAGTLSGGEQQMLAVGRALMNRPKMVMMDEPSLGLAPLIVQDIFAIIRKINEMGVTILLVEQNANMALKTADYGYVLETGKITLEGPGPELAQNEEIRAAYLGKHAAKKGLVH